MRAYLPNDSKMGIGGGWTFRRNLTKASDGLFEVVGSEEPWDVALVCGATMIARDTWRALLGAPGKVILRIDGIPEDWRNRGTGWPRLRDFARQADGVVYQSEFSRHTVGQLVDRLGPVILNGVDLGVFSPYGPKLSRFGSPSVLHVNYRGDPNKRPEEVVQRFRHFKIDHPGAGITFLGQYPDYLREWSFGMLDWEEGLDWQHMAATSDREMLAMVMRSHDYIAFPSFADPCPNTLIEALACECEPLWVNYYGGAAEIVEIWRDAALQGEDVPYEVFSLERMGREYHQLFQEVAG